MSGEPVVSQANISTAEIEADQNYYWCSSGRSEGQLFCDSSHQGIRLEPVEFKVTSRLIPESASAPRF